MVQSKLAIDINRDFYFGSQLPQIKFQKNPKESSEFFQKPVFIPNYKVKKPITNYFSHKVKKPQSLSMIKQKHDQFNCPKFGCDICCRHEIQHIAKMRPIIEFLGSTTTGQKDIGKKKYELKNFV